jgi:hypothetical protein
MATDQPTKIKPGTHKRKQSEQRRMLAAARDLRTLELFVAGTPTRDIQAALGWGHPSSVTYAIRRALARRVEETRETVEEAKALYLTRLERLLESWMPLATGTFTLDEEEPPARPDPRAADIVLRILTQIAEVEHTTVRVPAVAVPTVSVHNHVYSGQTDPAELQSKIMGTIEAMRNKMRVVDGTFTEVGTTLAEVTGRDEPGDAPPPLSLPHAPEAA